MEKALRTGKIEGYADAVIFIFYDIESEEVFIEERFNRNQGDETRVMLPGGTIEDGEDSVITLFREVREEMGKDIKIVEYEVLERCKVIDEGLVKMLQPFLITKWEGDPKSCEPAKVVFFRENVQKALSLLSSFESGAILLFAIGRIRNYRAEDFINAPLLSLPQ